MKYQFSRISLHFCVDDLQFYLLNKTTKVTSLNCIHQVLKDSIGLVKLSLLSIDWNVKYVYCE